jgi:hypothetical protein
MGELTKEDLWVFAYQQQYARFKDFARFCHNEPDDDRHNRLSRTTMNKYLRELVVEGKLERQLIHSTDRWPQYKVPEQYHNTVLKLQQDITILQVITEDPSRFMDQLKHAVFLSSNPPIEVSPDLTLTSVADVDAFLRDEGFSDTEILTIWLNGHIMNVIWKRYWQGADYIADEHVSSMRGFNGDPEPVDYGDH